MLVQPTISKMHEMKMSPMAEAFSRQIQDPAFLPLAFEKRVGMIIDAEYLPGRTARSPAASRSPGSGSRPRSKTSMGRLREASTVSRSSLWEPAATSATTKIS